MRKKTNRKKRDRAARQRAERREGTHPLPLADGISAFLPDGTEVPFLVPQDDCRSTEWDFVAFDRAACASGVKKFVRPASDADAPVARYGQAVLVEEITPGFRLRHSLALRGEP